MWKAVKHCTATTLLLPHSFIFYVNLLLIWKLCFSCVGFSCEWDASVTFSRIFLPFPSSPSPLQLCVTLISTNDACLCVSERRWKIRSSWSTTCWTRWTRWSSAAAWPSPSSRCWTTWRWDQQDLLAQEHPTHTLPSTRVVVLPQHVMNPECCYNTVTTMHFFFVMME